MQRNRARASKTSDSTIQSIHTSLLHVRTLPCSTLDSRVLPVFDRSVSGLLVRAPIPTAYAARRSAQRHLLTGCSQTRAEHSPDLSSSDDHRFRSIDKLAPRTRHRRGVIPQQLHIPHGICSQKRSRLFGCIEGRHGVGRWSSLRWIS